MQASTTGLETTTAEETSSRTGLLASRKSLLVNKLGLPTSFLYFCSFVAWDQLLLCEINFVASWFPRPGERHEIRQTDDKSVLPRRRAQWHFNVAFP